MPPPDIIDIVVSAPAGGDIAVIVAEPDEPSISLVLPAPQTVQVAITEAPSGADGTPGPAGADGAPGANAEIVVLSLADYLALTPEAQMDGTWYVVPKQS